MRTCVCAGVCERELVSVCVCMRESFCVCMCVYISVSGVRMFVSV